MSTSTQELLDKQKLAFIAGYTAFVTIALELATTHGDIDAKEDLEARLMLTEFERFLEQSDDLLAECIKATRS